MVIQQNTNVSIWGWADPGEIVTVKGSWMKKAASVGPVKMVNGYCKLNLPKQAVLIKLLLKGKIKLF